MQALALRNEMHKPNNVSTGTSASARKATVWLKFERADIFRRVDPVCQFTVSSRFPRCLNAFVDRRLSISLEHNHVTWPCPWLVLCQTSRSRAICWQEAPSPPGSWWDLSQKKQSRTGRQIAKRSASIHCPQPAHPQVYPLWCIAPSEAREHPHTFCREVPWLVGQLAASFLGAS